MKYKLLIFFCFGAVLQVFSQAKPIYFNGNRIVSDARQATSYGVYGKLSGEDLWVLKRYDLYDNLMLSGAYKDEQLAKPHGKFIFYGSIYDYNDENFTNFKNAKTDRYITQDGSYVDGLEEGKWTDYFPDGKILGYRTYLNGKLHGDIALFNYKGRREIYGHYKNGLKDGTWYNLKRRTKEIFNEDKLISTSRLTREEIQAIE
ncbi:toxin-antitoxin system YwqK family antitoxin [Pedobacter nanyangensis]|uniref:toxin-antitoxin system YwqK family antitoxin n=1 Tax=Pedobacter nanyangensis TaxID=1562389 RepID=UPI000DE1E0EA|nr:hypothetical protein [Pedobacter nanyangensis]